MNIRTLIRASLVPIGFGIAMRGIEDLTRHADQLRDLVHERHAYLAGVGPLPDADQPEPEPAAEPEPATARYSSNGRRTGRALALLAAGLVVGVAAGRGLAGLVQRAELPGEVDGFFPAGSDAPWDTIRSMRMECEGDPGPIPQGVGAFLAAVNARGLVPRQPDAEPVHTHTETCPCPPLLKQPEAADGLADPDDEALGDPAADLAADLLDHPDA